MKNLELFKTTMDVLWKAYKNGHLVHGSACECAVGNMIYNAMNQKNFLKKIKSNGRGLSEWTDVLGSYRDTMSNKTKMLIMSTGYTDEEIYKIEHAFEGRKHEGWTEDRSGLLGFKEVIKTLGEIHDAPCEVTECLIKAVEDGTYSYESEVFAKLTEV